jgi:maltokinase
VIEPAVLAHQVAQAPPHVLLPDRSGTATTEVDTLALVDQLDLGDERVVLVVRDSLDQLRVVPALATFSGPRRADVGDGASEALLRLLVDRPGDYGRFVVQRLHGRPAVGERAMGVDQTNESVVVGESAVVKWLYHVSSELHPAPGRLSLLDRAGFAAMPQPWGFVFWRDGADRLVLLATIDEYLGDATNGWTWGVDDVRRLGRGELTLAEAVEPASRVGDLVASMHVAFATEGVSRADAARCARWQQQATAALAAALDEVDGTEGERLRHRAEVIADRLRTWSRIDDATVIPVHGDLHVGQILRYRATDGADAYAITDFDGNPVLESTERTAAQPAARDVAGYLQALDHVGRIVVRRTPGVDARVVSSWIEAAQRAFLDAYRSRLEQTGAAGLLQEELLDPLRVEQECRELLYAVRYDPTWRYVPDAAMAALLATSEEPPGPPVPATPTEER